MEREYSIGGRHPARFERLIAPLTVQTQVFGLAILVEGRREREFASNEMLMAESLASLTGDLADFKKENEPIEPNRAIPWVAAREEAQADALYVHRVDVLTPIPSGRLVPRTLN